MFSSSLLLAGLFVLALLLAALVYLAALSRHRKSALGQLNLVGAKGSVEKSIAPEGSVLIGGESWPARSSTGAKIERGRPVRVVGARGHTLEVEPLE